MSKWYNPTGNKIWDSWYKYWGIALLVPIALYVSFVAYKWYTAPCLEIKKEMPTFYAPARCIGGQ